MEYKELKRKKFKLNGKRPIKKELNTLAIGGIGNTTLHREVATLYYEMIDEEFYNIPEVVNIDGYDFYKSMNICYIITKPDLIRTRKFIEI